jgi:hypothetical protein
MVDSEGSRPHSAAASRHNVTRHRDSALFPSVCFVLLRHCHCLHSSSFDQPFHSFFLSFFLSLHFLLVVAWSLRLWSSLVLASSFVQAHSSASASAVLPFLGAGIGGAPIRWCRPQRCSPSLAPAVLPFLGVGIGGAPIPWRPPLWCSYISALVLAMLPFLGVGLALGGSFASAFVVLPFLGVGLGSAPIPRWPRPPWWSSLVPRRRLGGPPWPHLGALHKTFGSTLVLRTKPSALPWWCSSLAPCLRLGAPHKTFGLALAVLLLSSSASLLLVRFGLIVECRVISRNTSDSHLHSSLSIPSFLLFLLSFYHWVFLFFIRLLQNTK